MDPSNPIRIANAPCSWGVIENTAGQRTGYRHVLQEMQQTGYEGTELGDWGFMPTRPELLKSELERYRLQLIGSWVTVRLYDRGAHEKGVAHAVRVAELMAEAAGEDCFVIIGDDHSTVDARTRHAGRITAGQMLDEPGWQVYIDGLLRVAEAVRRSTGLRSVIHHHGATYVETPGEIRYVLERTDPDLLGLCFDTGHYALGGGDPSKDLTDLYDRIWHVHFKDFDPSVVQAASREGWGYQEMIGQGVFPELGRGRVDFPSIVQKLDALGYDRWIVVEQDVLPGMGAPAASAAQNRAYLKRLGY